MATRKKTTPASEATDVTPEPATVEAPESKIDRLTPDELRDRRTGLGLSREMLATFAGISSSRVWASEQANKEISDDHYAALVKALDQVEALPLAERNPKKAKSSSVTKAEVVARLATVRGILEEATTLKTNAQLRACVEMALAAAAGTEEQPADEPSGDPEPSGGDEPEPVDEPSSAELVAA